MVATNNLLARYMLHRIFDKQGWESIEDREKAIDLACRLWIYDVPAADAVAKAKEQMHIYLEPR